MKLPAGYLEYDQNMPDRELVRIKDAWNAFASGDKMIALPSSVRFVHLRADCPDAFCRYCASPNLTSSVWCTQCGAQMLDGDR